MSAPLDITAGPLSLRPCSLGELDEFVAVLAANVEHLADWLAWSTPANATRAVQYPRLLETQQGWRHGDDYVYLAWLGSEIVGCFGLHRRIGPGGLELGYWVAQGHTGRGYATMAARAVTDMALTLPDVTHVEIHCDEANQASGAIPRKLGFRFDRFEQRKPEARRETGRLECWIRRTVSDPAVSVDGVGEKRDE